MDWSAVSSSESLEEAGLHSLDKASFFLEVETETGVRIPDEVHEVHEGIDSIEGRQEALKVRV